MRKLSDPILREVMLNQLRGGWPTERVLHAAESTDEALEREFTLDPQFRRDWADAASAKYVPVEDHAIRLALRADEEGGNKGSLEALKAVLKLLNEQRNRGATRDNIVLKSEVAPTRATGLIMTAEGARALAQELKQQKELTEQEDDQ